MAHGDDGRVLPRVLVLWDIDRTLIDTRGLGPVIYRRAFEAVTGRGLRELPPFSGRTDLAIMAETLRLNDVAAAPEAIDRLAGALVAEYEKARRELIGRGTVLPGAKETLASLAQDTDVYQSVLTGNLRALARLKIEAFGLSEHLDLAAGAYGGEDGDRAKLVPAAQWRSGARAGTTFPNERTVLIGDTPNDVRAALDVGAKVVAVATGLYGQAELRRAGAEHVLSDLCDADAVRRAISLATSAAGDGD